MAHLDLGRSLSVASESLNHLIVPKSRRPRFDLQLKIIELNNVPLVSGTSFIKWHLPHSTSAEHRGRTPKCHIKEHKVAYDYERVVPVRLTVDKNNHLQETPIHFEVVQEYSSSARGERIALGLIKLNLSEYVEPSEYDGEDGICRRYLMQESKINSTLKIGIHMTLVEGDRTFIAPPLKSAPVFGGIAGIMAGEAGGDMDDDGPMATMNAKTKEYGESQDLYRRNLAAFWVAQPGELPADECIEKIFAGGSGWASSDDTTPRKKHTERHNRQQVKPKTNRETSPMPRLPRQASVRGHQTSGVHGRASLEQHAKDMKDAAAMNDGPARHEVDEFDVRDDLRSWHISTDNR